MSFSASTLAGLQQIADKLGLTIEELRVSDVPSGLMRRLNQLGIIFSKVDSFPANWLRRIDQKLGKTPIECVTSGSKEDLDTLYLEIKTR